MSKQKDSGQRNEPRNGPRNEPRNGPRNEQRNEPRNEKRDAKRNEKTKEREKKSPLGENIVRNISNFIQPYIQPVLGMYYGILHIIIMCIGSIILLFDTNIYHLLVLLIIVTLDGIACVILHNCPLTILERKYLGTSIVGTHMFLYQNMNVCYTCDHEYEITLEFIFNMAALLTSKIFLLIVSKLFCIEFTVSFATPTR